MMTDGRWFLRLQRWEQGFVGLIRTFGRQRTQCTMLIDMNLGWNRRFGRRFRRGQLGRRCGGLFGLYRETSLFFIIVIFVCVPVGPWKEAVRIGLDVVNPGLLRFRRWLRLCFRFGLSFLLGCGLGGSGSGLGLRGLGL